ncbi:MAG TPA: hypothetical protein VHM19_22865 [Polyangiales bacterium]|jgi:hypothetical protein|nr:hypothetical protein [Polyangiales bacterium]
MQPALEPLPFYGSLRKSHGLTCSQVAIYGSILAHARLGLTPSQAELGEFAGVNPRRSNVWDHIRTLMRKGLVRRIHCAGGVRGEPAGSQTNRYVPLGPGSEQVAA